jgi:hydroxymethylglutaryl-CoA lyase/(R)-citramalyl-CoA lyase
VTERRVELCDVGPRDGLQDEAPVPPPTRAALVDRLVAARLPRVEVASFVREDLVPAMAGAEEVVAAVGPHPDARLAGLVLNERGYERLRATGLTDVHVSFGATDTFQQRNAGSTAEEGLATAGAVARRAHADGLRVTVTVSCAFGCPYEGRVDPGVVYDLVGRAAADADAVVLADTIGVAGPSEVASQVARCRRTLREPVGVHLHDTRGTALPGVIAALEAGATLVDASVGGIGGCPFAPGAQGNVATEDVVYLLEREGIATGVDLDALVAAARWLEGIVGHPLPGRVQRAGAWPG